MARLYADENFPLPVVEALQRLGHDVRTTHEAGQSEQAIPTMWSWPSLMPTSEPY